MKQRNALITGASRGIGFAIAKQLAKGGFNCVLLARDSSRLENAVTSMKDLGVTVFAVRCDVTDPDQIETALNTVRDELGSLDVLVNCAGRSGGGVTADLTDQLWLDVIHTNLNSVFFMTRQALKEKLVRKGGAIINIASTGGKQGVVHGAPYSASKHGVIGFTKALGLELARAQADITVNAVCPGFVESEMAAQVRTNFARIWDVSEEEARRRIEARVPIGRYIEPDEVAAMVDYLVSPGARGVTAQAMNVCGGLGNY